MRVNVVNPDMEEVKELQSKFIVNGLPVPTPASELLSYEYCSVRALMQLNAVYVWPTLELINWIKANNQELSSTIEIGAGNGVLSRELGIPATDSFMQSTKFEPKNKMEDETQKQALAYYGLMKQQLIHYGDNVEQYDAVDAIQKYKPKHILGCYITHKFKEGMRHGNMLGVNEEWILQRRQFQSYTMIGNLKVHEEKPILKIPHQEIEIDGLVLRAEKPELNRIFVWTK